MKANEIKKAAKELNSFLALEPAIDIKTNETILKEKILTASDLLEEGEFEELDENTQAVINFCKEEVETKKAETPKVETKKVEGFAEKMKAAKAAKEAGVVSSTVLRIEFATKMIIEGKHTQKEIVAAMCEAFPANTVGGHKTILQDGKNPKYNKFPKLIVIGENNVLQFAK